MTQSPEARCTQVEACRFCTRYSKVDLERKVGSVWLARRGLLGCNFNNLRIAKRLSRNHKGNVVFTRSGPVTSGRLRAGKKLCFILKHSRYNIIDCFVIMLLAFSELAL
jgi:hypothetical protein